MFTPHSLYIKAHNRIHTNTHTRAESEIHQSLQHYRSQNSQIDTSVRARGGGIKGEGRLEAGERRWGGEGGGRLKEWESWLQRLDVWRCIIHVPAGIMLDPAVRVGVRQPGRRARPVKGRGCVDITPGRL